MDFSTTELNELYNFPCTKTVKKPYDFIKTWVDSMLESNEHVLSNKDYDHVLNRAVCSQVATWLHAKHEKGAKQRGKEFTLTVDELYSLLKISYVGKGKFRCNDTTGYIINMYDLSLDRTNNDDGYNINNVKLSHKTVNISRNASEESDFNKMCLDVTINLMGNNIKDIDADIDDQLRAAETITKLLKLKKEI